LPHSGKRLIEQNDARLRRQHHRDLKLALFAVRQMHRGDLRTRGQSGLLQRLAGAAIDVCIGRHVTEHFQR
jgi:hypothetical protein